MREFKGTPGPWFIADDALGNMTHVVLSKQYPFEMLSKENLDIITAAPELLSALQRLLEIYDDHSGKVWTTSSKRRALDNARAAVNKALGETK